MSYYHKLFTYLPRFMSGHPERRKHCAAASAFQFMEGEEAQNTSGEGTPGVPPKK